MDFCRLSSYRPIENYCLGAKEYKFGSAFILYTTVYIPLQAAMETKESVSEGIYHNLITTLIQDIVAKETTKQQLLRSRYPNLKPYCYDPSHQLDINGLPKQQESSQYLQCENCNRDISANRFAAHLQRCLSRGARR